MADRQTNGASWNTAFLSSADVVAQEAPPADDHAESRANEDRPVELRVLGDLDHAIGDLSHPGSIEIHGHVEPGLTVFSTGRIRVHGDVRGGRLVAGGDIEVTGAVGGPGDVQLDAIASISVGSARHAELTAGGDIRCRGALVECVTRTHGRLLLTGPLGQISGGRHDVGGGIEVRRLGSSCGSSTQLILGDAMRGDGPDTLETRLRLCAETMTRAARRIDRVCHGFDALTDGRAAVIQEIRRLIGERTRTLRLQASLLRQRKQGSAALDLPRPHLDVGLVLPGVTVDTGTGPRPVHPTTTTKHGGTRGVRTL